MLPSLRNIKLEDIKPIYLIILADQLKSDIHKDSKASSLSITTRFNL
ncbi:MULTISPECIES: hypothetical protein [Bacillus]|nr:MULTISPECIES: hypothetical protein [Bacillus]